MQSRLTRVKDWAGLAKSARYSTTALARICSVSPRQLERFFLAQMANSPHTWLRRLRMQRAIELIRDGAAMKEVALELCYKDSAHFTHDFKNFFGVAPSQFAQSGFISSVSQKLQDLGGTILNGLSLLAGSLLYSADWLLGFV